MGYRMRRDGSSGMTVIVWTLFHFPSITTYYLLLTSNLLHLRQQYGNCRTPNILHVVKPR